MSTRHENNMTLNDGQIIGEDETRMVCATKAHAIYKDPLANEQHKTKR